MQKSVDCTPPSPTCFRGYKILCLNFPFLPNCLEVYQMFGQLSSTQMWMKPFLQSVCIAKMFEIKTQTDNVFSLPKASSSNEVHSIATWSHYIFNVSSICGLLLLHTMAQWFMQCRVSTVTVLSLPPLLKTTFSGRVTAKDLLYFQIHYQVSRFYL